MRLFEHHERRASLRCDAVKNQSRLEFSVPDGRRRIKACLINISRDGALIVTEEPPPRDVPLLMRIESPVKTDWVEVVTVRVGRDREVAIQFPERCPDDLFLAATIGIDLCGMFRIGARPESSADM